MGLFANNWIVGVICAIAYGTVAAYTGTGQVSE